MIHIKEGVTCENIKPILIDGLLTLAVLFHQHEVLLVVTALKDGTHKVGSLHYRGYAADIRARDIPDWMRPYLLDAMHETLGLAWDVILELKDGVYHYHVEYDPAHDGGKGLP